MLRNSCSANTAKDFNHVLNATLIFFLVGIHLSSRPELCARSFLGLNFVLALAPADSPAPCDQEPFDN